MRSSRYRYRSSGEFADINVRSKEAIALTMLSSGDRSSPETPPANMRVTVRSACEARDDRRSFPLSPISIGCSLNIGTAICASSVRARGSAQPYDALNATLVSDIALRGAPDRSIPARAAGHR